MKHKYGMTILKVRVAVTLEEEDTLTRMEHMEGLRWWLVKTQWWPFLTWVVVAKMLPCSSSLNYSPTFA